MEKYALVTVIKSSDGNAGPKAPRDISDIMEKTGRVESILLEAGENQDYPLFLRLIQELKRVRMKNQKVILQYPLQPFLFYEQQERFAEAYSYLDPDKTIMWIHDINQIRFADHPVYQAEMKWLQPFRRFIVHNGAMKSYLQGRLQMDLCLQNEIFDYVCGASKQKNSRLQNAEGERQIVFAGNLRHAKSPFLYELEKEKMRFTINAYGRREELIENEKICYCGGFDADVLPERLRGDLGLVWDGSADSTDENTYKNYTRYNAPHKFSCYMAAGLPVIAWREAAIAEVIQKYQVGYLIDNLYEINDLDFSRYSEYQKNAQALGEKVRSGYFTKRVFAQVEERWNAL